MKLSKLQIKEFIRQAIDEIKEGGPGSGRPKGNGKPDSISASDWNDMDADEKEYHTSGQYDKDAERDDTGKDDKPYTDDDEDHGGEPEKSAYDQMGHEARELKLTMDSSSEGYDQQYVPILKNLTRKMKKGVYDRDKAAQLFMYYVNNGAKRYVKDYGGTVRNSFPKDVRMQAARAYVEDFEDEYENKNWDFMENLRKEFKEYDFIEKNLLK